MKKFTKQWKDERGRLLELGPKAPIHPAFELRPPAGEEAVRYKARGQVRGERTTDNLSVITEARG
jgi:hypothetical protein